MSKKLWIACLLLALPAFVGAAPQADLYVAENGNDAVCRVKKKISAGVAGNRVAITLNIENEDHFVAIILDFGAHAERTAADHQSIGLIVDGSAFAVTQSGRRVQFDAIW